MINKTTKTIACVIAGLTLTACGKGESATDLFDYPTLQSVRDNGIVNTFVTAPCPQNYCIFNTLEHDISYMTASLGSSVKVGAPITDITATGSLIWNMTASLQQVLTQVTFDRGGSVTIGDRELDTLSFTGELQIDLDRKIITGYANTNPRSSTINIDGTFADNQTISGDVVFYSGESDQTGTLGDITGIIDSTKVLGIYKGNGFAGGFIASK